MKALSVLLVVLLTPLVAFADNASDLMGVGIAPEAAGKLQSIIASPGAVAPSSITSSGAVTLTGTVDAGGASKFEIPNGTDLPDSPAAGDVFLDTNDGACDDANDSGGTAVCAYNGAAWVLLGNSGT